MGSSVSSLSHSHPERIIIGAIGGVIAFALLGLAVCLLICRRTRLLQSSRISVNGIRAFTYVEMVKATDNFSDTVQIGEGGYGKVYKGTLADGTVVAIKRAQEGSQQGKREFLTEIQLLSPLHHRNLVSLIGYCNEEGEQMLVYEYLSNGTLRDHLSDRARVVGLIYTRRMDIALGAAKGIQYLHAEANPTIFHRDVKASNILLDSRFAARVADFGLSRLVPVQDIEGAVPTDIYTTPRGTPGYFDPAYVLTGRLTDKSDVYSLGVVFLELLTGMQPISGGQNIVNEVNAACQSGGPLSVIDSRIWPSHQGECVLGFLNLALWCCQAEPDARPDMQRVARELGDLREIMTVLDTRRATTGHGTRFGSPPSSYFSARSEFEMGSTSGTRYASDSSGSNVV